MELLPKINSISGKSKASIMPRGFSFSLIGIVVWKVLVKRWEHRRDIPILLCVEQLNCCILSCLFIWAFICFSIWSGSTRLMSNHWYATCILNRLSKTFLFHYEVEVLDWFLTFWTAVPEPFFLFHYEVESQDLYHWYLLLPQRAVSEQPTNAGGTIPPQG